MVAIVADETEFSNKSRKGYGATFCECGRTLYVKYEKLNFGWNTVICPDCNFTTRLWYTGKSHSSGE